LVGGGTGGEKPKKREPLKLKTRAQNPVGLD